MSLKKFVLAALLIGMSFLGANIKILGTIAFDSMPAFVGTLLLGPFYGIAIGALGHMFTALLSGLPLGPIHIVVACTMALTMAGFWATYKILDKMGVPTLVKYVITGVVGTIINGPISLAISSIFIDDKLALVLLLILTIASALNIAIGLVIFHYTKGVWGKFNEN